MKNQSNMSSTNVQRAPNSDGESEYMHQEEVLHLLPIDFEVI